MAYTEINETQSGDTWYLDFGYSNHMIVNKLLFSKLDKTFREHVKLGSDCRISVMGKDNIKIQMNSSMQTTTSVFYVPELKNNLISIEQLQERGSYHSYAKRELSNTSSRKGFITRVKMSTN